MATLDCQACGACCVNPPANRAEGFVSYISLEPDDKLWEQPDLLRRWTCAEPHGARYMRLDKDGRCLALAGKLGRQVRCTIYHWRPRPCRRVRAGSDQCRWHRAQCGLP